MINRSKEMINKANYPLGFNGNLLLMTRDYQGTGIYQYLR